MKISKRKLRKIIEEEYVLAKRKKNLGKKVREAFALEMVFHNPSFLTENRLVNRRQALLLKKYHVLMESPTRFPSDRLYKQLLAEILILLKALLLLLG